jgi:hypothetical protein
MMLCRSFIGCTAVLLGSWLFVPAAQAQTNYYVTNGIEYSLVGALPGDQVHPDLAIGSSGGYVVWQDNVTDGSGFGISARRLDSTLSGELAPFRVNQTGTGNQENPRVAMLKDGGAVYVWQGGAPSYQHIYAAFQSANGTLLNSTDVLVNASLTAYQVAPAVAVLNNSNVVVVYTSFNQAGPGSMQDIYGQLFSPEGTKIGGEFLVNQFTTYNQRSASVAALNNGGFVVTWVSEQERAAAATYTTVSPTLNATNLNSASVDIEARLFDAGGAAISNEILVNTDNKPAANPRVASAADGTFMVVWSGLDTLLPTNGWDIFARAFSSAGVGGAVVPVNTYLYGDQLYPQISALNLDYILTWTSLGEDGSREGVYARQLHENGAPVGGEFRVNSNTFGPQIHPVVASDGVAQFLVVWSTFTLVDNSFDLSGQRFANVSAILLPMEAPYVTVPFTLTNGAYEAKITVSWPALLGLSIANFEVYVDGATVPTGIVTGNQWSFVASAGSTHSFTVDYVTTDNRRSPLSPSASGTTWSGGNWYGVPVEWMQKYFGNNLGAWPLPTADSDGDGASNLQEFLAGTDPTSGASVLKQDLIATPQGLFLSWNTQPGLTYQVQYTTNFKPWNDFGLPRFATGTNDSVYVGSSPGYYRILLQR